MRIAQLSTTVIRGTPQEVLAEVKKAADAGLSGYWAPMLTGWDTLTTLGVAGASVPGIELGTAVVPIPARTPYALAQQARTVQSLSNGRLVLGIGTSHKHLVQDVFGATWRPPLKAMREYLDDLRRYSLAAAEDDFPFPPVLLGALNPRMAELAAEWAVGTVTSSAGRRTLEDVILPPLRARGSRFRLVVSLPVAVTDDRTSTHEHVRRTFAAFDSLPSYQAVLDREGAKTTADLALIGNEHEVQTALDSYAALGVTDFAARIASLPHDTERTWRFLSEAVAPTNNRRSPHE